MAAITKAAMKAWKKAEAVRKAAKVMLKSSKFKKIKAAPLPKLSKVKARKLKDPKRKLKAGEERHTGKSKLDVLKRAKLRQQLRRADPDEYDTVVKRKKLSRRPQRKLRR